jgi:hypothetical protein
VIFFEAQEEKKNIVAHNKKNRIVDMDIISELLNSSKFTKFIQQFGFCFEVNKGKVPILFYPKSGERKMINIEKRKNKLSL